MMAVQARLELFLSFLVAIFMGVVVRRRYFHPLSKVPGPFWGSVTSLYHAYHYIAGDHHQLHRQLHEKYGRYSLLNQNS